MSERKSFVIIGGGASGVLLAAHLLRSADPSLRVVLVEKSGIFGRGLAYSTVLDEHLLNVGSRNMSAFADDPDHFRRWLAGRGIDDAGDRLFFAPRRLYGDYLGDIINHLAKNDATRLKLLPKEAVSLSPDQDAVTVALASGTILTADAAILAVGHDTVAASPFPFAIKPGEDKDTPLPVDAPVLILGTGLSMIDAWLALKAKGHAGQVTALSRRGVMPRSHLVAQPQPLQNIDVPLGAPPAWFMHWLRQLVRAHCAQGGDWQDVIDSLRPFNQRIWQGWNSEARRKFLRHAKAWWDVHRHRAAPQIHSRLQEALASRSLQLRAGKIESVRQVGSRLEVSVRPRGRQDMQRLTVARIYDCTGVISDPSSSSHTVLRSMIEQGKARPDPLGLGLDVTPDCAVIDASATASDRIFALGPLTRGTLFEIEAIPDIRVQAARLAEMLI